MTTPGDLDDRALLAAHVAGDPDAFGLLFARHRGRLWAVALRTLGDPDDAADALQDAMVAAFRRAGSYRGDAAVTTWLHRVVVNACLDRVRRERVRRTDPLPEDLDGRDRYAARTDPTASGGTDPATTAEAHERRALLLEALGSLPLEQRAALVLVDIEGRSVEETAAVLDVAPGTVKSRCSRGRARLATLLGPLLHDDAPGPAGNHEPRSAVPSRTTSPDRSPHRSPDGGDPRA